MGGPATFNPKDLGGNSCNKKSSHFPPPFRTVTLWALAITNIHEASSCANKFDMEFSRLRNPHEKYTPEIKGWNGTPQVMEEVLFQMRNSGVQFGVSGFWGNLSRQFFAGVNVPPRILSEWLALGRRFIAPHSLSSWTLLEDWVMIWFPRTVLSESWLHRKKAGPRPPKNLQRVLLVVLGFIPGTLKHQNIVKTSSFTVATYLKPHYLHQKNKKTQQNPP